MSSEIDDLLRVTALLRERALESYRRDLSEEMRHQGELDRIDGLRQQSFSDHDSVDPRRMLGADTLWQGWLSKRRGEINRAIAMSRAKQAHSMAAACLAFSRDEAAKDVSRQQIAKRRTELMAREESQLEELSQMLKFDPES
ncbi:hypothetical protein AL036_01730 [Salipiger aestuarii]|uniref:hypothetical protein n=1 Tax=Salipiger aestuarii TaxID=568098 RepID=UPI0012388125|nr:hypothetical protein [Salipiger aestuarii]KAA8609833.1 hypothetical protein AL036_01730 [Salipiger aestuarii]